MIVALNKIDQIDEGKREKEIAKVKYMYITVINNYDLIQKHLGSKTSAAKSDWHKGDCQQQGWYQIVAKL